MEDQQSAHPVGYWGLDSLVEIRNQIINPRYVVRIQDRGLVYAYCYGPKNDWVELYTWNPQIGTHYNDFMVQHVRSVVVAMHDDQPGEGLMYYGEEAERIWSWFSAIAVPLMDVTLDIPM